MKPSSDIALFTTTLPIPVLVSLILFLRRTSDGPVIRSGAFWARRSTGTAASTEDTSRAPTVVAPAVATHRLPAQRPQPVLEPIRTPTSGGMTTSDRISDHAAYQAIPRRIRQGACALGGSRTRP